MRTSLRAGAVAALLLTIGLAGCGTSDGDDAGKDATTTVATTAPDDGATTTAPDDEATTTAPDDEATTTAPGDETTTTAAAGDDDICVPLKDISDYDKETRDALAENTPWPEVQEIFVSSTEDVLAAYDEAIAVADDDVAADLQTLKDITAPTAELAGQSTSVVDLGTKLSALPGLLEAGQAGQRLDTFSRQTCGSGTSAAGD